MPPATRDTVRDSMLLGGVLTVLLWLITKAATLLWNATLGKWAEWPVRHTPVFIASLWGLIAYLYYEISQSPE